ncbi:MAG: hypothetical protein FJ138_02605, partial [Deltaproteobacteria bacterium]|nr:hypothetical protein [Deltaproteobacteria bacterium]
MCAFNSSCAPRALASLSRIAALLSGALGVSAAFCAAISAATLAPALAQPASTTKTRSEIVMEDQSRVFKGAEMKRQQLVEAQQELERRTARLKRLESEVIRRY